MKKFFTRDSVKAFLDGMADIFGLFTPEPRPRCRGFEDDTEALRGDWQAIGDDMRVAMRKVGRRMGKVGERINKVLEKYEEREYEK